MPAEVIRDPLSLRLSLPGHETYLRRRPSASRDGGSW